MLEHVIPANCRISVSPKHYETISAYIESAEAFGRNMFRPIFIVDMYKKDFLYVSNNFSYLFGEDDPEHPVSRGEKYIPSFAREDIGTLKTIFQSAYDLFLSFPVAERKELIFSFSFHHHRNGKKKVVHQSVTPLALTDDGDLWLVLCTTSYSSKKELFSRLYDEGDRPHLRQVGRCNQALQARTLLQARSPEHHRGRDGGDQQESDITAGLFQRGFRLAGDGFLME